MRAFYRSRKNMAASFRIKAARCGPVLRSSLGRQIAMVAGERKSIMKEKVYERGDPARPLSYNLLNSEKIRFRGNVGEISNSAPYVAIRDAMTGQSLLYGHDLELNFAQGAVDNTRKDRLGDVRASVRSVVKSG